MRAVAAMLAAALAFSLAGCDAPEEPLYLATVDAEDGLGLGLRELPEATLGTIGLGYGLAVIRLDSAAERAGLRLGDVVYAVNQRKLESLQDFSRAMAQVQDGHVRLLVRRGKSDLDIPLPVIPRGAPGGGPRDGSRLPLRQPTDTLLRT